MQDKTREELKNFTHIRTGKDKGRTEKHYPYLYKEKLGKNRETKAILMQGKTWKERKNITHIYIGKDKERVEKHYPYINTERRGKN